MSAARPSLCLVLALLLAAVLAVLSPELGQAAPSPLRRHRASLTEGLDCSACHTPESWKNLGQSAGSSGFDHARTGFPLTQRHAQVPCTGCHHSDQAVTRQCAGCHEDAHAGRLGAACDGCHSAAGWHQTSALRRHRQTRLPLTGMHALVECRDCHLQGANNVWSGTPADCFACHERDYRRPDLHPVHAGVPGDPNQPPFPRNCAQCHRASGWLPAFVEPGLAGIELGLSSPAAHDRSFPLSHGPHRGAPCASCHVAPSTPRAVRCTGCHAHDEVKLRTEHAGVPAFGLACLSCHPGGRRR